MIPTEWDAEKKESQVCFGKQTTEEKNAHKMVNKANKR